MDGRRTSARTFSVLPPDCLSNWNGYFPDSWSRTSAVDVVRVIELRFTCPLCPRNILPFFVMVIWRREIRDWWQTTVRSNYNNLAYCPLFEKSGSSVWIFAFRLTRNWRSKSTISYSLRWLNRLFLYGRYLTTAFFVGTWMMKSFPKARISCMECIVFQEPGR